MAASYPDNPFHRRIAVSLRTVIALMLVSAARAVDMTLIDFSVQNPCALTPSGSQVTTVYQPGIGRDLVIAPGTAAYPALTMTPLGSGAWNASGASYIEFSCQNIGTTTFYGWLRADNPGTTENTNTEAMYIVAGATATVRIYFGFSGKVEGYPLDPSNLIRLYLYTTKDTVNTRSLRMTRITAGGTYGEPTPFSRVRPKYGQIFGDGATFDPAKQLVVPGNNTTILPSGNLQAIFSGSSSQTIKFQPTVGWWDLGSWNRVTMKVKNTGTRAVSPQLRVDSSTGSTSKVGPTQPIQPGETVDINVPFAAAVSWVGVVDPYQETRNAARGWGGQTGTGTTFGSHKSTAVILFPDTTAPGAMIEIVSLRASLEYSEAPWLGQAPPMAGNWVKTFEENFDESSPDLTRWTPTATNYWDASVHFTTANLIERDGYMRLHMEKTPGGSTPYATGYLDTYGKWKQRYGYFEARLRLPDVPSMWPGFWLMPDRGPSAGGWGSRASTSNGGMEFDILEGQSIWGPYRSNIAAHWDGYDAYHQQIGSQYIYHKPDRYGFVTVGLLWTPGSMVIYSGGTEVARWDSPRVCIHPCFIIFTFVTGGWDHAWLDDSKLPADFAIDYVRVWQRQDLANASYDSPASVPAGGAITPLQAWRKHRFQTTESTGSAANDADPDRDGVLNLIEYALGTEPLVTGHSMPKVEMRQVGTGTYLALTITPTEGVKEGLTYRPEVSSDLSNWSGAEPDIKILEQGPFELTVQDSQPVGQGRRFIRLNITAP